MIETDGVSCSLLLLRKDLVGKKLPMIKKGLTTETYIDELNDYSNLQNKKIVAIDPGKCDLIYCVDNSNKEANELSKLNRKSLNISKFKEHIQKKERNKWNIIYIL
jgi:hypothetical protein